MTSHAQIGRNVREARLAAGLTLEALAARAGVALRTLTRVEHATHAPRAETLAAIAEALGTTPAALGVEPNGEAAA